MGKPKAGAVVPEESSTLEEAVVTALVVVTIAYVLGRLNERKQLNLRAFLGYMLDLVEASMYSICYFLLAMYFGGIVEDVYPHFSKHTSYGSLLLEVVLQAMTNTMVSQVTIDLVQCIPIPDLGRKGKALAAKGGGIIAILKVLLGR